MFPPGKAAIQVMDKISYNLFGWNFTNDKAKEDINSKDVVAF